MVYGMESCLDTVIPWYWRARRIFLRYLYPLVWRCNRLIIDTQGPGLDSLGSSPGHGLCIQCQGLQSRSRVKILLWVAYNRNWDKLRWYGSQCQPRVPLFSWLSVVVRVFLFGHLNLELIVFLHTVLYLWYGLSHPYTHPLLIGGHYSSLWLVWYV